MSDSTETSSSSGSASSRRPVIAAVLGVAQLVLAAAVLAGGVYTAYWFNTNEGAAQKSSGAREESSRLVETVVARQDSRPVVIRVMGEVSPAREAILRPRVSGAIIAQNTAFEPGGFFEAGSFMVQIDRADYEQTLAQRQSDLARAEAALQIELGDQAVAREELELLEIDIPEINRELILRIPQVNQAKAEVQSAEAAVQRAELDLSRTRIVAPFLGHIVDRRVSEGANVSVGEALATIVGADRYWIEASVPVSSLRWIETPRGDGDARSPARITYPRAWGPDAFRTGAVTQSVGRLEDDSRLARVLIEVEDPLALDPENADRPELIIGAFVNIEIEGRRLDDVIVIDRDLVREGDNVWVMGPDDRLVTKAVDVAFRGRDLVYITEGLADGDRIVRTNLTTPVDGMLLRDVADSRAADEVAQADRETTDG